MHFQEWDQAVTTAGKALANPLYRDPWAAQGNLGWAYLHKRELARASKELRQAVFSNPHFCVGRYRLAQVSYELKNLEAAQEELERVAADPKCPIQEAFHLLGLVSLRRGDRQRAEEAFNRCVALAPRSCLAKECRIVP
jgi:Tfp pilus assembly protein PilF